MTRKVSSISNHTREAKEHVFSSLGYEIFNKAKVEADQCKREQESIRSLLAILSSMRM